MALIMAIQGVGRDLCCALSLLCFISDCILNILDAWKIEVLHFLDLTQAVYPQQDGKLTFGIAYDDCWKYCIPLGI